MAVLRNHLYIEGGKISTYLNVEAASEREYDPGEWPNGKSHFASVQVLTINE